MPQVAQFAEVDVSAVQADAVVFTLPAILSPWARAKLPVLDSLYYDADDVLAVDLYLAPVGVAFTEATAIPLIRGATVQHEARFCYPIPIGALLVPWEVRMTKPASAGNAFVRLAWSVGA